MGGIDVSVQINKKLSRIGLWAITLLVSFVILFPLYWIVTGSFKNKIEINANYPIWFPQDPTVELFAGSSHARSLYPAGA